jgi:hypothetical protein
MNMFAKLICQRVHASLLLRIDICYGMHFTYRHTCVTRMETFDMPAPLYMPSRKPTTSFTTSFTTGAQLPGVWRPSPQLMASLLSAYYA